MNAEKLNRIMRVKRSRIGRIACRLLGDEKGAVMMEYVILGVLIAAAAVVAVTVFGKNIVAMFNVSTQAMSGNTEKAETTRSQQNTNAATDATEAGRYGDEMGKDAGTKGYTAD